MKSAPTPSPCLMPQYQAQGVKYVSAPASSSGLIGPQAMPTWLKGADGGTRGEQAKQQQQVTPAPTQMPQCAGEGGTHGNFTALSYTPETFTNYSVPPNPPTATTTGKKRRRVDAMLSQTPSMQPAFYPMEWISPYGQPMQWVPEFYQPPHPSYQRFEPQPQWNPMGAGGGASFSSVPPQMRMLADQKVQPAQMQPAQMPQQQPFPAQVAQAFHEHVIPGVSQSPMDGHWFQGPNYLLLYMPLNFGGGGGGGGGGSYNGGGGGGGGAT